MRKLNIFCRQVLILIIALQILNQSFSSDAYWHYYEQTSHAGASDPTETIVEWLVELKMGQQDVFNDTHASETKNTLKTAHWQMDLDKYDPPVAIELSFDEHPYRQKNYPKEYAFIEIVAPPPEIHFF
jgi:hypothetical protein